MVSRAAIISATCTTRVTAIQPLWQPRRSSAVCYASPSSSSPTNDPENNEQDGGALTARLRSLYASPSEDDHFRARKLAEEHLAQPHAQAVRGVASSLQVAVLLLSRHGIIAQWFTRACHRARAIGQGTTRCRCRRSALDARQGPGGGKGRPARPPSGYAGWRCCRVGVQRLEGVTRCYHYLSPPPPVFRQLCD